MNFRSINDLCNLIRNKISLVPSDVDLIIGIPRSGLLAANYIALLLNKPLTDIEGFVDGRILSSGRTKDISHNVDKISDAKKILIVDDSIASGASLKKCRDIIREKNIKSKIIYCAIYALPSSKKYVDIYFEIVNSPRIFEWNLFSHTLFLPKMYVKTLSL